MYLENGKFYLHLHVIKGALDFLILLRIVHERAGVEFHQLACANTDG